MIHFLHIRSAATPLLLLSLACLFASTAAQAQQMTLAPSHALSCLARKDGKDARLVYPAEALERKDGGVVKVEMKFTSPDRAPRVKITDETGSSLLEEAVSDYVDGFRVPCMDEKDGPVTLQQEYVFVSNDGRKVMSTSAHDDADAGRRAKMACIKNASGNEKPIYPTSARRDQSQGKFYVEMTFSAPDKAPDVEWLVTADSKALRRSVEDYLGELRMPCQDGEPVRSRMMFNFKLIDGDRTFFRDLTLIQFVSIAKDLPTPVYFDLNTMGCPFDLRVQYMRPQEKNDVSELETSNPARKAFIDWLSSITLNLSNDQLSKVFGDSFTLSVPCGNVNL